MALPTGSVGQSWGTFAFPITAGSPAVSRSLPTEFVVTYEAPEGLYASCLSTYTLRTREMGQVSSSIADLGDYQRITWRILDTTAPGVIDTVFFTVRGALVIGIGDIEFYYQFEFGVSESLQRRKGLFITSESSPHLSIEPFNFQTNLKLPGDIYLIPSGLSIDPGLRIIEVGATGNQYTGSFWTARLTQSIDELISRVTASNAVYALTGLITDRGYVTPLSGGIAPLVRNWDWDGGLYMADSTSVAIYGTNKNFLIPSGSLIIRDGSEILSGSVNVESGSIYIRGPAVRFDMLGESASAFVQGQPFVHLTQSTSPIVSVESGSPFLPDGTMVLVPDPATSSLLQEMHIRAKGNWYTLVTQSFDVMDGGFY